MQSYQQEALNKALDDIILSTDSRVIKSVMTLSNSLLEALDERCLEIEHTGKYKKRFSNKNKK